MACPSLLVVGMGFLDLKGYALCVSLSMQMNGTHCYNALR